MHAASSHATGLGRFFTEQEVARRANVVVIGKDTRQALFGDASGLGVSIHINGIPFTVIGVPCNQFLAQEPGSADEIAEFCSVNYGVTFPLTEKIEVNGDNADPLYDWLKKEAPGVLGTKAIKWNFTKFLIDRSGEVAGRYGPLTTPDQLRSAIEALL